MVRFKLLWFSLVTVWFWNVWISLVKVRVSMVLVCVCYVRVLFALFQLVSMVRFSLVWNGMG